MNFEYFECFNQSLILSVLPGISGFFGLKKNHSVWAWNFWVQKGDFGVKLSFQCESLWSLKRWKGTTFPSATKVSNLSILLSFLNVLAIY